MGYPGLHALDPLSSSVRPVSYGEPRRHGILHSRPATSCAAWRRVPLWHLYYIRHMPCSATRGRQIVQMAKWFLRYVISLSTCHAGKLGVPRARRKTCSHPIEACVWCFLRRVCRGRCRANGSLAADESLALWVSADATYMHSGWRSEHCQVCAFGKHGRRGTRKAERTQGLDALDQAETEAKSVTHLRV